MMAYKKRPMTKKVIKKKPMAKMAAKKKKTY